MIKKGKMARRDIIQNVEETFPFHTGEFFSYRSSVLN
jgi:hypothetical protein